MELNVQVKSKPLALYSKCIQITMFTGKLFVFITTIALVYTVMNKNIAISAAAFNLFFWLGIANAFLCIFCLYKSSKILGDIYASVAIDMARENKDLRQKIMEMS